MKVAIFNRHPLDVLGGSEMQCDNIAVYLTRFGHQATYIAINGSQGRGGQNLTDSHYATPYPVIPIGNLNPIALYKLFRQEKFDVVYWRYGKKGLFTSLIAAKWSGSRFVYSLSHESDSRTWVHSGNRLFTTFQSGIRRAGTFRQYVRNCYYLIDPLRSALGMAAVRLGADGVVSLNADFLANIPVRAQIAIHNSIIPARTDFAWPRPYVVWVANIKSRKNPEQYYKLAKALENSGIDFLMIGALHDPTYSYLAAGEHAPANFHYLGPKSPQEVNGILHNALFLVHTCDPEGFGNNFIQAWLQAKPTITLYFDPEGIIESEGLGYFSRTFPQLIEDTRRLLENTELRAAMGQKAKAYATTHFDPEKNVRRLEQFLKQITQTP